MLVSNTNTSMEIVLRIERKGLAAVVADHGPQMDVTPPTRVFQVSFPPKYE